MQLAVLKALSSWKLSKTLSDLLECTATWQLVGYDIFLSIPLSIALPPLLLFFLTLHFQLVMLDGWPVGWLVTWSHCGYVAVVVPGAPTDRSILMYGQCGFSALMKNCTATNRPSHMAQLLECTLHALIGKGRHKTVPESASVIWLILHIVQYQ